MDLHYNVCLINLYLRVLDDEVTVLYLIDTLRSLETDLIAVLHISFSLPMERDMWQALHATLVQPKFGKLRELCISVEEVYSGDPEEVQRIHDDLEIFAHLRGFRREINGPRQ